MRRLAGLVYASSAAVLACGGEGARIWLQQGSGTEATAFGLSLSGREARPFPTIPRPRSSS